MPRFLRNLIYFHGLFVLLLYLVSNFFTIIILEYRLKSNTLKHTLAAFGCVAFSGMVAYYLPVLLLGTRNTNFWLQITSIVVACAVQTLFWFFWFKKDFTNILPALLVIFVLSVVVALLIHYAFLSYVRMMVRSQIRGAVSQAVGGIVDAVTPN